MHIENTLDTAYPEIDRRKFPRYDVRGRMTLAVEDESIGESIGLGEACDISLGGLRVMNLPVQSNVTAGDKLGLLLFDEEDALSLHGEVVHHGTTDSFGVAFLETSMIDGQLISALVSRLQH
jgi:hypothetical protein